MNFLRGNFGAGGGGEENSEESSDRGGGGGGGDKGKARDHASFFSWRNIWSDTSESDSDDGKKSRSHSKGRRGSSAGLAVIEEGENGDGGHGGPVGNGSLLDDSRDDSDTLKDDDQGSNSSSETVRRESITGGIRRVVTKASSGGGTSDDKSGYFNLPWKDKGMSFPWKKNVSEEKSPVGDTGKSSLLSKKETDQEPSADSGRRDSIQELQEKLKGTHFPWQSSDGGDDNSSSELPFSFPFKISSESTKKETTSTKKETTNQGSSSSINFPWWSGYSDSRSQKADADNSGRETSEGIDNDIVGDESASLIGDAKTGKAKQKKENTNPFQNVPWFIGGSSEKKTENKKEARSPLSSFSWNRDGSDKKGESDTWSAAINIPWLQKAGEKTKDEKAKTDTEIQDQKKSSGDVEADEESDDDDIDIPYVVRRVRKSIDEGMESTEDMIKRAKLIGKYDISDTKKTSDTSTAGKDGGSSQSSTQYLEQLVGLKTRADWFKEKILQNLGKADKTTDDVFDEFELNFSKQQNNATRLHKEISNYLRCCRALHGASKSLYETLGEVYEPEWVGHELLYAQAQNSDMLYTDFCHKVQDQALAPLTAYTSQFPEIRKKIDKRGRKLVDYDSQRHQLENLQRATRRDEYKIARAQDTLETARVTYEALNKELYEELPLLYDQRIPNVSNHVQSLFAAESTFMNESSKVAKELEAISEKLTKECAKGTYKTKQKATPRPLSVVEVTKSPNSPSMWYDGGAGEEGENSLQLNEVNDGVLEISAMENSSSPPMEMKQSYKSIPDNDRIPTPPSSPLPIESLTNNDADSGLNPPPPPTHNSQPDEDKRPTISGPLTHKKEEIGRPYEEIEFEDKKVNGTLSSARSNGEVIGTKVPNGSGLSNQGEVNESSEPSEVANASSNLDHVDSPLGSTQEPGTMAPSVSPAAESVLSNGPSFTSPLADLNQKVEEIYDIPVGGDDVVEEDLPVPDAPPTPPVAPSLDGGIQNGTLTGATTEGLPQGVLYRVRATYKYTREDVDEISFEVGDIIQVVEYEDPEEQEEGWLCGVKEGTTDKGLFPANFTRPI